MLTPFHQMQLNICVRGNEILRLMDISVYDFGNSSCGCSLCATQSKSIAIMLKTSCLKFKWCASEATINATLIEFEVDD